MLPVLQVLALLLVAVAMALALAHALEWPGKRRLSQHEYAVVQQIYYPGFTWGGGVGEAGGLIVLAALAILTPAGTQRWLTLGALAALVVMHAAYWVLTHPVNRFWLKDVELRSFDAAFFRFGARDDGSPPDWTELRDRWELSHAVRAGLGLLSLALLGAAAAA